MPMKHALTAFSLFAALAACATPPPAPYGPAARSGAAGYTDTAIEQDRYRVSYYAPQGGGARASDMALLRAAEITLQRGDDWFVVTQRNVEPGRGGDAGPRMNVGVGAGSFGGHTGVSLGTGVGFNLGGDHEAGALATLEVRLGKGVKPQDPSAYDAREVERSLGPRR
jgi:hypothetical protein